MAGRDSVTATSARGETIGLPATLMSQSWCQACVGQGAKRRPVVGVEAQGPIFGYRSQRGRSIRVHIVVR
ncbi:MAG TPA: hypothetical protein VIJ71_02215 [Mycobacteriales bacterium]